MRSVSITQCTLNAFHFLAFLVKSSLELFNQKLLFCYLLFEAADLSREQKSILAFGAVLLRQLLMRLQKPNKLPLAALESPLQLLIGFFQSKLPILQLRDLAPLLGDQLILLRQ